jgi:hypothetical protein
MDENLLDDLVAANRILAEYGVIDATATSASARPRIEALLSRDRPGNGAARTSSNTTSTRKPSTRRRGSSTSASFTARSTGSGPTSVVHSHSPQ